MNLSIFPYLRMQNSKERTEQIPDTTTADDVAGLFIPFMIHCFSSQL